MNYSTRRAYIELHIAVLLFGITAILGDLIELPALVVVWWRMLMASLSLVILLRIRSVWKKLSTKMLLTYACIGIIVAIHWLCFFGSVKLSNASITLVCMATATPFTALLEPFLMRQKFNWYELGLGLLMVPGMTLVVNGIEVSMMNGVWVGLLSAFLAALFSILNKKHVESAPSLQITLIELSSGWLVLTLIFPFFLNKDMAFSPTVMDWVYLCILAFGCTTLAYVLALRSLKRLSAFASTLAVNLEPVYGILLAWWLLNENEYLSTQFYIGVSIILLAVFSYPLLRRYMRQREKP